MENRLIEQAKGVIPSVDDIIEETLQELNYKQSYVENHFGDALVGFDMKATEIFRSYEVEALKYLARSWINQQREDIREKLQAFLKEDRLDESIEELAKIFVDFGMLVKDLEKDLGNMRKARGGKTFEKAVYRLLSFIGIPCEMPTGENSNRLKRVDIVVPSVKVGIETPDRAVFLACKRTLRERWKQEVPQVGPNWRVYLLTIDEDISENKANEIKEKGFIAYVRDELKRNKFQNKPWIRALSSLPADLGGFKG